jgi:hypothetical protein
VSGSDHEKTGYRFLSPAPFVCHPSIVEPKYLGECLEDWRTLGPAKFAATYGDAMLQLRDLGSDARDDDDANFHTAFMSREALKEAADSAAGPGSSETRLPAVQVGQFVAISKRQGGVFQDRIGIGRARNVDVPIQLAKFSKYHAFFSRNDDGTYTLTDAGSTNGTFLEGKRLPEKQAFPIRDGQDVSFGPYRFTFFTPEGFHDLVKRRAGAR